MRVVFAGTPEVALPALAAVAESAHELVGVVTRPDAPTGRGRRLTPSPVAEAADALGVPVLKPGHPREPDFQAALRGARARTACPVVAYGALLPQSALDIPPRRLGQPPLLAAAGLAGRRAGAARDLGRRRRHRSHHVPDRQGARRRTDLRADDRDHPARRHGRRPARAARRGRRRAPGGHARRASPTGRSRSASSPVTTSRSRPRSPSTTHASTGPSRPRSSTGRSAPVRRRREPGRPTPASGSSSARSPWPTDSCPRVS